MTWKMDVRKDEPAPLGWHKAVCLRPEPVETAAFGARFHWRYRLLESGIEVSGWTSMSPSTRARAYQWAETLNGGPIDPKVGWGPETVEGKRCWVKVEAYKDSKGETRTKVTEIAPIDEEPGEEVNFSDISA
jgi:hypothetical protein